MSKRSFPNFHSFVIWSIVWNEADQKERTKECQKRVQFWHFSKWMIRRCYNSFIRHDDNNYNDDSDAGDDGYDDDSDHDDGNDDDYDD